MTKRKEQSTRIISDKEENGIRDVVYENGITIVPERSASTNNPEAFDQVGKEAAAKIDERHSVFDVVREAAAFAAQVLLECGYSTDYKSLAKEKWKEKAGSLAKLAYDQHLRAPLAILPALEKLFPSAPLNDKQKGIANLVMNAYWLGRKSEHLRIKRRDETDTIRGRGTKAASGAGGEAKSTANRDKGIAQAYKGALKEWAKNPLLPKPTMGSFGKRYDMKPDTVTKAINRGLRHLKSK